MAIAPEIPGLQVTINVNGETLSEYDYDVNDADHDPAQPSVSKYLPTPEGAEFEIGTLYKEPFSPPFQLHADIMMDGNYVLAPFMEWGGKEECEGYKYCRATFHDNGAEVTRNFRFAALQADEEDRHVTEDERRQIRDMGKIVVYMYYVEDLEEANPVNIPQVADEEDRVVNQKAMKGTIPAGDRISRQTTFSAPEQREAITYHRIETTSNEPFAAFTFYYRSEAALKSLGIIPRTPSPTPPPRSPSPTPERNLDDMTEEEMREELKRLREQQHEHAIRIKREREDSVATLRGDEDEDDDVKFVEERTAERVAKRAKQMPGEDDEVVELDSD